MCTYTKRDLSIVFQRSIVLVMVQKFLRMLLERVYMLMNKKLRSCRNALFIADARNRSLELVNN